MLDPRRNDEPAPIPADASASLPGDADVAANKPTEPKLSKEEQMALYEEYLKENDWGHQPC
jgi:hypothetical protein